MNNQYPFSKSKTSKKIYFIWLLRIIIIAGFVFVGMRTWSLLKNPNFMPIKTVKIDASYQHLNPQNLQDIIAPYVSTGLFSVDVENLKRQLLQQPWIYNVLIRRVWPDELEIQIDEQQTVAIWNKTELVNVEGDVFIPPIKTFPQGLPLFQGPDGQQQIVLQQYQQFSGILAPLHLTINEIHLNPRHSWQLKLNDGTTLLLGRGDVIPRLNRFVAIYPKIFTDPHQQAQKVDLRYSNGLAVEWKK